MNYDYIKYWQDRYKQYEEGWKSSGNQTMTDEENEKEYMNQLVNAVPYFQRNIKKDSKILEIGCGFGFWEKVLKDYNYFGVDIVKTKATDDIIDITNDCIFFKFDIILMINVEQHIYEIEKAIENIKKMMTKKSVLITTAWSVKKESVVSYEFHHGLELWEKHFKITNKNIFSEKEKIIMECRLK